MNPKQLTNAPVQQIALGRIAIGPNLRTKLGSVIDLKKSILDIGLIHPVVVTDDAAWTKQSGKPFMLVAGQRRLRAVSLGKAKHISARVISGADVDDLLRIQTDENEQRQDLNAGDRSSSRLSNLREDMEAHVATIKKDEKARVLRENPSARALTSTSGWAERVRRGAGANLRSVKRDVTIEKICKRYPELSPWGQRPIVAAAEAIDAADPAERKNLRALAACYEPKEGPAAAKAIASVVDRWPKDLRQKLYKLVKSDPLEAQVAAAGLPPVPDERLIKLGVIRDDLKQFMAEFRKRDAAQGELSQAFRHLDAAYQSLRGAYDAKRSEFEEMID